MTGALAGPAAAPLGRLPPPDAWLVRAAALAPLLAGPRRTRFAVWLLVALAGACWAAGREAAFRREPAIAAPGGLAPSRAAATEAPVLARTTGFAAPVGTDGWQAPALVVAAGGGGPPRGTGLMLRGRGDAPAPGALLGGVLRAAVPRRASLPGAFDDRTYLAGRGLALRARAADRRAGLLRRGEPAAGRALARTRDGLRSRLERLLPERESRLASAVLLGHRTADSRREAAAFTDLGLAHLFAVSGLHVGILAGCAAAVATAAGVGRSSLLAVMLPLVPAYMLLTGLPGSVVRAGGMVLLVLVVRAAGRRAPPLRLAGLLCWGTAVWDPARVLDLGSLLSYAAAAGILAAGALTDGFAWTGRRRWNLLLAGLGVSVAAQWATLPLVAGAFGRISAWSPLANLVVVPAFGALVALLAGALVLDAVWTWAAEGVAGTAWLLARAISGAVAACGPAAGGTVGLPAVGAAAVVLWGALTIVLGAVCRRRGRWLAAAPVIVATGVAAFGPWSRSLPPAAAPRVVVFDVGQGDAALVTFPDGWTALIDTGDAPRAGAAAGPLARTVIPWLARQGVDRLDAVVLTHGHRDHTGGAPEVARRLPVGAWYAGGGSGHALGAAHGRWWPRMSAVDTLHRWRGWTLHVIDPEALPGAARDENDRSLAAVLARDGRPLVFLTGDLEHGGEERLLAAGQVPADVPVWKAGHHGSATSGGRSLLERVRPRLVVVSCGTDNRHGHPSHGPYVAGADSARVLRTDLDGTVFLDWDRRGGLRVRTAGPRRAARLDTVGARF